MSSFRKRNFPTSLQNRFPQFFMHVSKTLKQCYHLEPRCICASLKCCWVITYSKCLYSLPFLGRLDFMGQKSGCELRTDWENKFKTAHFDKQKGEKYKYSYIWNIPVRLRASTPTKSVAVLEINSPLYKWGEKAVGVLIIINISPVGFIVELITKALDVVPVSLFI